MTGEAASYLTPWANFYVMTGSSAAALTGLMFVVISLVTDTRVQRNPDGISTFSTPTVVHFCAGLLGSAILSAPWRVMWHPAALLAAGAVYGVIYVLNVMRRTRKLTEYEPDTEDWVWFAVLPLVAYAGLLCGAIALPFAPVEAMFVLAAGIVFLILIGIRNAWDVVTFLAVRGNEQPPASK